MWIGLELTVKGEVVASGTALLGRTKSGLRTTKIFGFDDPAAQRHIRRMWPSGDYGPALLDDDGEIIWPSERALRTRRGEAASRIRSDDGQRTERSRAARRVGGALRTSRS